MKKYILSIFAVVIAVGMAAFTAPEHSKTEYNDVTFYYTSANFSDVEVAKKTNWSSEPQQHSCTGYSNKACVLVIDINETELMDDERVLKNDIDVMPGSGGTGAYVPSDLTAGYVDRADKQ